MIYTHVDFQRRQERENDTQIDNGKGTKKQNWDKGQTTTEFIHDCAPFYGTGEGSSTHRALVLVLGMVAFGV